MNKETWRDDACLMIRLELYVFRTSIVTTSYVHTSSPP